MTKELLEKDVIVKRLQDRNMTKVSKATHLSRQFLYNIKNGKGFSTATQVILSMYLQENL